MMQAVVFVGGPIARRRMAAIKWHKTGPNRDRETETQTQTPRWSPSSFLVS